MANELAYALITPYSLMKSRTGGIISRFMNRTSLELVATRLIAPGQELIEAYAKMLERHGDIEGTGVNEAELLSKYVLTHFSPDEKTGQCRRVMLLMFEGEDAVARVNKALGRFRTTMQSAESVRDTHGDLVRDAEGNVVFIEPAAITSVTVEQTREVLRLWADASEENCGIQENLKDVPSGEGVEHTLVMLKPDNFKFASVRPGTIIDIFSQSGLRIVAAKIDRMSIAEALEFYGPVRNVLREKKKTQAGELSKRSIERELGYTLPAEVEAKLGDLIGPEVGDRQFNELVQFMTGKWAPDCPPEEHDQPGHSRILALVYCGHNAVKKIRDILGPTDPSKAAPGSVRKEYGQDVMVNAAHASDSPENAKREMGIIKIHKDGIQKLLKKHYG
jgi:nucleoside diphosphate kinase